MSSLKDVIEKSLTEEIDHWRNFSSDACEGVSAITADRVQAWMEAQVQPDLFETINRTVNEARRRYAIYYDIDTQKGLVAMLAHAVMMYQAKRDPDAHHEQQECSAPEGPDEERIAEIISRVHTASMLHPEPGALAPSSRTVTAVPDASMKQFMAHVEDNQLTKREQFAAQLGAGAMVANSLLFVNGETPSNLQDWAVDVRVHADALLAELVATAAGGAK